MRQEAHILPKQFSQSPARASPGFHAVVERKSQGIADLGVLESHGTKVPGNTRFWRRCVAFALFYTAWHFDRQIRSYRILIHE